MELLCVVCFLSYLFSYQPSSQVLRDIILLAAAKVIVKQTKNGAKFCPPLHGQQRHLTAWHADIRTLKPFLCASSSMSHSSFSSLCTCLVRLLAFSSFHPVATLNETAWAHLPRSRGRDERGRCCACLVRGGRCNSALSGRIRLPHVPIRLSLSFRPGSGPA